MKAYHITRKENLKSIFENGLVPYIGKRSRKIESRKAIYLFPTMNDLETALYSWLENEFEENEELIVLEVDVQGLRLVGEVDWEVISYYPISSDRVKLSKIVI